MAPGDTARRPSGRPSTTPALPPSSWHVVLCTLAASWMCLVQFSAGLPTFNGRTSVVPARRIASLDPGAPFALRLADGTVMPQCHKPPSIDNAYLDLDLYKNAAKDPNSLTLFSVGEQATYHCLPGYFAGRPYQYQVKARCAESRDGTPYWEVRGVCTKYPKCSVPPMLHDAVIHKKHTGRREFDTGERIEFACDDGYMSTLGPSAPPFTTCSFSGFAADWDPIVGDCLRHGESKEAHQRLHDSQHYAEDKRVARIRADIAARQRRKRRPQQLASSPSSSRGSSSSQYKSDDNDNYEISISHKEDPVQRELRRRRNMNTMIKEQERVFQTTDTSNGGPPFFDEANDFAKDKSAKKNLEKDSSEKSLAGLPDFQVGSTKSAEKDESAALKAKDGAVDAAPAQSSSNNQGIKKIEEDAVGPKFVLHQEGPAATTAVGRLSAAFLSAFGGGSGKMEQDSAGDLQHYHTSQKDINRDIYLDKLIHHFQQDHPQVLKGFKYEELHNHAHKVAELEGDIALMEGEQQDLTYPHDFDHDDDEDDEEDDDYGDEASEDAYYPGSGDDVQQQQQPVFDQATVACIQNGFCTPDGKPRWLTHQESRKETRKLAHLMTMQKFNPQVEPRRPPRNYKQKGMRKAQLMGKLPTLPVACDGPSCQREWQMKVPPAGQTPADGGVNERTKNVPEAYQHHNEQRGRPKLCKGDNCELRPPWGLEAKGPSPTNEKGAEKPELVRLLWPGHAEVGKSPDYDAGSEEQATKDADQYCPHGYPRGTDDCGDNFIMWIGRPENLIKVFLGITFMIYGFLMLRCFFRCSDCFLKCTDECAHGKKRGVDFGSPSTRTFSSKSSAKGKKGKGKRLKSGSSTSASSKSSKTSTKSSKTSTKSKGKAGKKGKGGKGASSSASSTSAASSRGKSPKGKSPAKKVAATSPAKGKKSKTKFYDPMTPSSFADTTEPTRFDY